MSRVLDIVMSAADGGKVILVSSAISGCTDALLAIAEGDAGTVCDQQGGAQCCQPAAASCSPAAALKQRHLEIVRRLFTGREREEAAAETEALFSEMAAAPSDEKVTFGELFSTRILYRKLLCNGVKSAWLDSRKLVVKDNIPETYRRIKEAVQAADAEVIVAPGFICSDSSGKVCTLGRGGSDYSAALYAAAIQADALQIWTDVPGIMTANPKEVAAARTIARMSYAAALDMAEHGAKVLYAPTVAPAMEAELDIEIRNTFDPEGKHTVISAEPDATPWIGVTSEGGTIRVVGSAAAKAEDGLLGGRHGAPQPTQQDALAQAESALSESGIAALDMKTEGCDLVVKVRETVKSQALTALHRCFFQVRKQEDIALFIAGNGAVGKALLRLIDKSAGSVVERSGKTLRVLGLADSKHYGIGAALTMDKEGDYVKAVIEAAPEGAVFIDCTDSDTIWTRYAELFEAGISVVSSNRRSFAIPYTDFAALHTAAREHGVFLRYETTVGAALPILSTILASATGCDDVQSIEAVVSCTLNQILGSYSGEGASLASLVRRAQEDGLTEPDPRTDLGGRDALRKLLILARVAGISLEESDVTIEPAVPLKDGPLEDFYASLLSEEKNFAAKVREAAGRGCRLRFVASVDKAPGTRLGYKASIRLQEVPLSHPAYFLEGTENAIIVQSTFHPYPLVIQGSGEGALQAASSILNDILR